MVDNEESESGGFSALEGFFNNICGGSQYVDSINDNVVTTFCGGKSNDDDNLQKRHTNIGFDRGMFMSDYLHDDGEDPTTAFEITRILSADAHLLILSDAVIESLKTLGKVDGISMHPSAVGFGEDGPSLASYASRCVERTKSRDIYSVSYCPTDLEKTETSNLPPDMSSFLKPWSMLLKRGVVSVQLGGVVGGSPQRINKKTKGVGFAPGKSCRQSHGTTTKTTMPAHLKGSISSDTELILLNHALVVVPPTSSNEKKDEDCDSKTKNTSMSFPLTSVLAVMDLGACSCKSLEMPDVNALGFDSPRPQDSQASKHKSMFKKMKKVKMSKLLSIEDSPATISKQYDQSCDDDCGSTSEDDSLHESQDESAFRIVAANPSSSGSATVLTVHCKTATHKILWLHALHRTISGLPHLRKPFTFTNTRFNNEIGKQHSVMRTSMYSACVLGDAKMLDRILQGGKSVGTSPLRNTSRKVIDVADSNGYTALHYSVMCRSSKNVPILLDAGANPNIQDSNGMSPVDYADEMQQTRALDMLMAKGGMKNEEVSTKINGNAGTMKSLLGDDMQKRHEKLSRMEGASAGIHAKSIMYRDMARQLKEKAKN